MPSSMSIGRAWGLALVVGICGTCDSNAVSTSSLVKVSPEPRGTNCKGGGQRIETGPDRNGDGVLGTGEVTATSYVCQTGSGDPVVLQRTVWAQSAEPISMNHHSDSVVGSTPMGSGRLSLSRLSRSPYNAADFGRSAAEITDFNPATKQIFTHDTWHARVSYYTLATDGSLSNRGIVDPKTDITDLPTVGGPYSLGVNSCAVSDNTLAVVVEVFDTTKLVYVPGRLVMYDVSSGGAPVFITALTVGPEADHVSFTHDGKKALVAGEGEPAMLSRTHDDTSAVEDPEGTFSVIARPAAGWKAVSNKDVQTIGFEDFNEGGSRAHERPPELHRIAPEGTAWSKQFEPEYIAYSADDSTAWIVLQEMNAVAIVDLTVTPAHVKEIHHLGFKDGLLPGNEFDASDLDGRVRIANWPVFLMYQPDTIKSFLGRDGKNYFATANEGDMRAEDWGWRENQKVSLLNLDPIAFPGKDRWQQDDMLGRLQVTTTKGDSDGDGLYENLYGFGGRSFSIWDEAGNLVFDSGNDFERITARLYGEFFNDLVKEYLPEGNSPLKGPEPEALSVGVIRVPKKVAVGQPPAFEDRTFAFIGAEKISGWWVYDVTDPSQAEFVTYFSTRHPEVPPFEDTEADLSPEGSVFVSAADSPTGRPLLIAGNEVSSTTSVYEISINF